MLYSKLVAPSTAKLIVFYLLSARRLSSNKEVLMKGFSCLQFTNMSETLPETLVEFLRCNLLNDLPDDPDMSSQHKILWYQLGPSSAGFSRGDLELMKHEEFLRMKWPCSEAMPASFDPDKLEADRQAQSRSRNGDKSTTEISAGVPSKKVTELHHLNIEGQCKVDEQVSDVIHLNEANVSDEFVFVDVTLPEPLDPGEEIEDHNREVIIQDVSARNIPEVSQGIYAMSMAGDICGSELVSEPDPDPVEHDPPPRMGLGSKPPLSRSAYATVAQPCHKDGYLDKRPCMTWRRS
ncbi:hypothetical protein F4814DRAFT_408829 [Daldinia grandis]|nr:hypothetical protein F4814DRAFT_408829 [Daldinia grandis]